MTVGERGGGRRWSRCRVEQASWREAPAGAVCREVKLREASGTLAGVPTQKDGGRTTDLTHGSLAIQLTPPSAVPVTLVAPLRDKPCYLAHFTEEETEAQNEDTTRCQEAVPGAVRLGSQRPGCGHPACQSLWTL